MQLTLPAVWLLAWGQSGFSPDPTPLPERPPVEPMASAPILLWSHALPGLPPASASRSESASPVLRGDKIYLGFSGDSALLIVSRRDGSLLGRLPTSGVVASAPVFDHGNIYVADLAGYLWCFEESSGKMLWSRYTSAPIISSPTLGDNSLYVTNVDDQVYSLDPATGDLRWRHAHRIDVARAEKLTLYGAPSAVIEGNEVLTGFSDGSLVGLGRSDGEEHWNISVGEGAWPDLIAPPMATSHGLVVGGFSGPLLSLAPDTHAIQWRVDAGSAAPWLLDGEFLYQGGADGVLRKMNTRTGDILWKWQADIPGLSFSFLEATPTDTEDQMKVTSGTVGTPILTPQGLLVANSDGSLYLVNPADGKQMWALEPGFLLGGILATPAVEGSEIYAVSNAGILYSLRGAAPKAKAPEDPWVSPKR